MINKTSLSTNKIANKQIINAIGDFTNVSEDTVKLIVDLCEASDLYNQIFIKLADEIRIGIDTQTIRIIAKIIKEDLENTLFKSSNKPEILYKGNDLNELAA